MSYYFVICDREGYLIDSLPITFKTEDEAENEAIKYIEDWFERAKRDYEPLPYDADFYIKECKK